MTSLPGPAVKPPDSNFDVRILLLIRTVIEAAVCETTNVTYLKHVPPPNADHSGFPGSNIYPLPPF